jgi:hypothetical protein
MAGVLKVTNTTITITDASASNTVSFTPEVSTANCIPFSHTRIAGDTGSTVPSHANDYAYLSTKVYFSGGNIVAERSGTSGELVVVICVVEFDSARFNVQQGDFILREDQATAPEVITSVTQGNALVHFNYEMATNGEDDNNAVTMIRGRMTSGTEVAFDRGEETANISDMVFASSSGTSTQITGTSLPTLSVGSGVEVTNHSTSDNNGVYEVTTVNTINADYTCTKVTGNNPANAGSEAADMLTAATGLAAPAPRVEGKWYTAESTSGDFTVDHSNFALPNNERAAFSSAFTAVDTAKTFVLSSLRSEAGANNDNTRMIPGVSLFSTTQLMAKRYGTSKIVDIACCVVEFAGDETVQRGSFETNPVSDLTFEDASGQSVNVISSGNLPSASSSEEFEVRNHATQNGWYTLDTATSTSLWACTKHGPGTAGNATLESADVCMFERSIATQNDVTIAAVADTADAWAHLVAPASNQGAISDATFHNAVVDNMMTPELTSTTNLRLLKNTNAPEACMASWEVIEWDVGAGGPGPTRRVMVIS